MPHVTWLTTLTNKASQGLVQKELGIAGYARKYCGFDGICSTQAMLQNCKERYSNQSFLSGCILTILFLLTLVMWRLFGIHIILSTTSQWLYVTNTPCNESSVLTNFGLDRNQMFPQVQQFYTGNENRRCIKKRCDQVQLISSKENSEWLEEK